MEWQMVLNPNQQMYILFIPLWIYGKAIAFDVFGASSVDFSDDVE
jgi:hypothetical protein